MGKERVLIVDDEKNIVSSLHGILKDEGYEITTAGDGLDALEQLQADPPDLVLLDIWLPGMDGIEVLKTIKTYHPEIEVLIMSGHGTIDTAVKATKLGAFDFIEKPFTLDHLVQTVDKALQQKRSRGGERPAAKSRRPDLPQYFKLMVEVTKAVKAAATHHGPVLITGEPGTGKELIAQAIHQESPLSRLPFITVNCATRSMTSLQGELFVPKRRTGAGRRPRKEGDRVVYLKNIEMLSPTLQEKLAEALQAVRESGRPVPGFLPARLFASTTQDLDDLLEKDGIKEALYHLLKPARLPVPPLREMRAHIPELVLSYFEERAEQGPAHQIREEALEKLVNYAWPGNLKELRDVLDYLARTVQPEDVIGVEDLPPALRPDLPPATTPPQWSGTQRVRPQRTLKRSMVLCGRGLHSGIKTGLIMQPLPPNSGIIFGDISSTATIPARLENVESTAYSTCLKKGFFSVATIEHIMAVLHMYRITNLLIKIGDEAPVMDGSAKDFCQLIEDGGYEDQDAPCGELAIQEEYFFGDPEGAHIRIEPAEEFTVSYHMEYPEPIGVMDYTFHYSGPESFKQEIAPARTFGFMEDVAQLTRMGFATGGKLDNFILLGDKKVLNTELRFPDEFVRHKILDILGDSYLLGQPMRARISAHKSGHTENVGLLKEIKKHLVH